MCEEIAEISKILTCYHSVTRYIIIITTTTSYLGKVEKTAKINRLLSFMISPLICSAYHLCFLAEFFDCVEICFSLVKNILYCYYFQFMTFISFLLMMRAMGRDVTADTGMTNSRGEMGKDAEGKSGHCSKVGDQQP